MQLDTPDGASLGIALEPEGKRLSRAEFQGLGEMPPELEWFANLDNPRTRRAYRLDVRDFTAFAGVERSKVRYVLAHPLALERISDYDRRRSRPEDRPTFRVAY